MFGGGEHMAQLAQHQVKGFWFWNPGWSIEDEDVITITGLFENQNSQRLKEKLMHMEYV